MAKFINIGELAKRKWDREAVLFHNELFAIGRHLTVTLGEREFSLLLKNPQDPNFDHFSFEICVGHQSILLELADVRQLACLDGRVLDVPLHSLPAEFCSLFLESIFEPYLGQLEGFFNTSIRLLFGDLASTKTANTDEAFSFSFQLCEGNPHRGKATVEAAGNVRMNGRLAGFVLDALQKQPRAIVRTFATALPKIYQVIDEVRFSAADIQGLRQGDVIFLPHGKEVAEGQRALVGLQPYRLICSAEEQELKLQKIIPDPQTINFQN